MFGEDPSTIVILLCTSKFGDEPFNVTIPPSVDPVIVAVPELPDVPELPEVPELPDEPEVPELPLDPPWTKSR